ncbi:DUF3857 domain-containing protein [Flavihumibacter rivuli]|uniref:DUF3857 domain-containing protein n=1 Tax=Flavihumibacter rivuli TaxID=2838156 RepID=UPI001BDF1262|nr:DUF3857 domain-containing protein [Flavihumibacter rivuli]ULQ56703.1 DUF3857 domain-containing protein [Flavihumibacter rivuli]
MKMKCLAFAVAITFALPIAAQQRIDKKELQLLKEASDRSPLLLSSDKDFEVGSVSSKWNEESAVILCQKTNFVFDKKGVSVGKRVGRNIFGLLFAIPSMGFTVVAANMYNETKVIVEESERRKILLKDKFALEQFSVLYFRLAVEGDAFAARVIKKNGTEVPVDLKDAVKVEDPRSVPDLFRSYSDKRISAGYRPNFFKVAIPDLEEGDIIDYEFRNINTQQYSQNPKYKEFNPVYYVCNKEVPVKKQIIEVAAEDDKYFIGYRSAKGAPEFKEVNANGKRLYRWEDGDRDRKPDVRYVNDLLEQPSIKFQVVYARKGNTDFVWFKDKPDMQKDMSSEEFGTKVRHYWFSNEELKTSDDMSINEDEVTAWVKYFYKKLKKNGVTNSSDDDYMVKAYYYIRARTMFENFSSFEFAKIFSGLLALKKIDHEIVVSASNFRTTIGQVAFRQELEWLVRCKNNYFVNPGEHTNPFEVPVYLAGNNAVKFNYSNPKGNATTEILPLGDSSLNALSVSIKATLDAATKVNLNVERGTEVKGVAKDEVIDDILSLTPFIETDYRNYDGLGLFEGMSASEEEKAREELEIQKKEWKEEKPKMMKAYTEQQYGVTIEKYNSFKVIQDGRNYKKRNLKYFEQFVLGDMTSNAGEDLVLALPLLVGGQSKIKSEEVQRSLPVDVGFPRTLQWNIIFVIPDGYTPAGLESLNKSVSNEYAAFASTAKIEGNNLVLEVRKVYKMKHVSVSQWPMLLEVLEAAHNFSQSKVVLRKK